MIKQRFCSRLLFGIKSFFPHFILKLSALQLYSVYPMCIILHLQLTISVGMSEAVKSILLHSLICLVLLTKS